MSTHPAATVSSRATVILAGVILHAGCRARRGHASLWEPQAQQFARYNNAILLMVVFGAGASYDSVPACPAGQAPASPQSLVISQHRPPLANELFADRENFAAVLAQYPECNRIVPYLRHLEDRQLEEVLGVLVQESDSFPRRREQLTAVRFYLHELLWRVCSAWVDGAHKITNYGSLLDEIDRNRSGEDETCIVTFNYDTLIEDALATSGLHVTNLSSYIAHPTYKLIKLHGSVNWGRCLSDFPIEARNKDHRTLAAEIIARAAELHISNDYALRPDCPIVTDGRYRYFVPAIAVPVQTKQQFECPAEHIEALKAFIPKTSALLIIGWRAADAAFLDLLNSVDHLPLRVGIVAGGDQAAREVQSALEAKLIGADYLRFSGGFTEFVIRRQFAKFCKFASHGRAAGA
jgi:hypothetical protein